LTHLSAETASIKATAIVGANAPITSGEETGSPKKTLELPPYKLRNLNAVPPSAILL